MDSKVKFKGNTLYDIDSEKIQVVESKSADSRTADHIVSKDELLDASVKHIADVKNALDFFAERLKAVAENHDFTKLAYFEDFYKDFHKAQIEGQNGNPNAFKNWKWMQEHLGLERHHIEATEIEDINLFDVLEYIADIVMAAMARSGKFEKRSEIDKELLAKAFDNTINLLLSKIEVKSE